MTMHFLLFRRAPSIVARRAAFCFLLLIAGAAGCSHSPSTPTGSAAAPAAATLEIPVPPPAPSAPPIEVLARSRAQVDSVTADMDYESVMQAVVLARRIGDLWKCEQLLRVLQRRDPKDRLTRQRIADTCELEQRLGEARTLYDGLRREDPKNVKAYLGLASICFVQKNRAEAFKWIEQANQTCRDSAPDLLLIARRYVEWEDLAGGEKVLRSAQAVAPKDSAIGAARGELMVRAGKIDEARKLLESVTAADPASAEAWKNLAWAWSQGPIDSAGKAQARTAAEKAVELNAGDPFAYHYAGLIYRALGEPRRAAQSFAKALVLNPNGAEARFNLAELYGALGKPDWRKDQLRIYQAVTAQQRDQKVAMGRAEERPTDPATRVAVGRNMEKAGDLLGAVRQYQIAVTIAPHDAEARSALTNLYDRLAWGIPPAGPPK